MSRGPSLNGIGRVLPDRMCLLGDDGRNQPHPYWLDAALNVAQPGRFGLVLPITLAVESMTLAVGRNGPCTALRAL